MTKSLKLQSCETPSSRQKARNGIWLRRRGPMMGLSLARPSSTTEDWFARTAQVQSQRVFPLQPCVSAGIGAECAVVAAGDVAPRQIPCRLAREAGNRARPTAQPGGSRYHLDSCGLGG